MVTHDLDALVQDLKWLRKGIGLAPLRLLNSAVFQILSDGNLSPREAFERFVDGLAELLDSDDGRALWVAYGLDEECQGDLLRDRREAHAARVGKTSHTLRKLEDGLIERDLAPRLLSGSFPSRTSRSPSTGDRVDSISSSDRRAAAMEQPIETSQESTATGYLDRLTRLLGEMDKAIPRYHGAEGGRAPFLPLYRGREDDIAPYLQGGTHLLLQPLLVSGALASLSQEVERGERSSQDSRLLALLDVTNKSVVLGDAQRLRIAYEVSHFGTTSNALAEYDALASTTFRMKFAYQLASLDPEHEIIEAQARAVVSHDHLSPWGTLRNKSILYIVKRNAITISGLTVAVRRDELTLGNIMSVCRRLREIETIRPFLISETRPILDLVLRLRGDQAQLLTDAVMHELLEYRNNNTIQ